MAWAIILWDFFYSPTFSSLDVYGDSRDSERTPFSNLSAGLSAHAWLKSLLTEKH